MNPLIDIQTQITQYEQEFQRQPGSVKLLAVSKNQSIEKISKLYDLGQRVFGESYLQEALPKIQALADKNIEWHFIGAIQSNKTNKIASQFTWVQTVANFKIAQRLNEQRPDKLAPLNICLQVNISEEKNKAGLNPRDLSLLAEQCQSLPRLKLRGLMTIPAVTNEFTQQRNMFNQLYQYFQKLCTEGFALDTLSMGMSADFKAAIAEGSTLVRIGTALFGKRS